jgi:hypothetical protein
VQLANFYNVDVDYFVNDKEKLVFYLTGNHNTQATNRIEKQCNEYHGNFTEEKLQLINELKNKEITMQQHEIENLKEIITLLKTKTTVS